MNDAPEEELQPSKSQLKREAEALQDLGEALVRLGKADLAKIELPDQLAEAIQLARKMPQRGALKRQLQYIGKLMRSIDATPIQEAYNRITHPYREDVKHHHELEAWRDRLIHGGDAALGELVEKYPDTDRQHVRQLIRMANKEFKSNKPPKAARELFRYLRDLLDTAGTG